MCTKAYTEAWAKFTLTPFWEGSMKEKDRGGQKECVLDNLYAFVLFEQKIMNLCESSFLSSLGIFCVKCSVCGQYI